MILVKEGKGGGRWGASYGFTWLRGAPPASVNELVLLSLISRSP